MKQVDIERFEMNPVYDPEYSVSMSGVMPEFETDSINIGETPLEPGIYLSVRKGGSQWSFISGFESVIQSMCLTVNVLQKVFKSVVRRVADYYRKVKMRLVPTRPCFLRL